MIRPALFAAALLAVLVGTAIITFRACDTGIDW